MSCALRVLLAAVFGGLLLAPVDALAYNSVGTTATYYHPSLHGSVMANGRPYNRWDPMIAASNWYPLDTLLKITRQGREDHIYVRVQDRGSRALTIDLSEAGFARLGGLREGRIPIWAEVVDAIAEPAPAPAEEAAPTPSEEPSEPAVDPTDLPVAPEEIEDVAPPSATALAHAPRPVRGVRPTAAEASPSIRAFRL